ncbi:MAG: hypothetical protein HZA61_06650 [Candidatus Eisenbacteria bacterium]|uniref:FlgD/Vpr Ig-like domain-containing protein n=1 Tax=Eiseniibacteriota bacterium TaxID=2212470 RepID=A0A933SFS8_UNCEI|nr:hypothetical protein [Candidatus Eisenbacteria bacterium]
MVTTFPRSLPGAPLALFAARAFARGRARAGVRAFLVAACVLPGLVTAAPARAAWPANPATNVPVCNAAGVQAYHGAITDGQGGVFVAWADSRTGTNDIYVQHISVSGLPIWNPTGRLVCGAAGDQDQPVLVGDGAGGVYVAWRDFRNGVTGDLYAQRVDATSTPQWQTNGVAVCTAPGEQAFPVIATDGRPLVPGPVGAANPLGVIVAWEDWRSSITIHAQRIDASGAARWTANGMALSASSSPQFDPACVEDGQGGAFVVWAQQGLVTYDIAGQHVQSDGTLAWGANGATISAVAAAQVHPVVCRDGSDGAYVAWEDHRGADSDVYAQRLGYFGNTAWLTGGQPVCTVAGDQWQPMIAQDGMGGALLAWTDQRAGSDIYAQRLSPGGNGAWAAGGMAVGAAVNVQQFPTIANDGRGGAIVSWEDYRAGTVADIYAQRVTPAGAAVWAANGQAVSTAPGNQYGATVVADGDTVGIVVWTDQRSGGSDIYCQRVPLVITLDADPGARGELAAARLSAGPNPAFGAVSFAFSLARAGEVELEVYDASGRRVRTLARGPRAAGAQSVAWDTRDDAGRACAPGAYWARLRVDGAPAGRGTVTLRR